jgi:hypothetical protein
MPAENKKTAMSSLELLKATGTHIVADTGDFEVEQTEYVFFSLLMHVVSIMISTGTSFFCWNSLRAVLRSRSIIFAATSPGLSKIRLRTRAFSPSIYGFILFSFSHKIPIS